MKHNRKPGKPHLYFANGYWRAVVWGMTVGGTSPIDAYNKLIEFDYVRRSYYARRVA